MHSSAIGVHGVPRPPHLSNCRMQDGTPWCLLWWLSTKCLCCISKICCCFTTSICSDVESCQKQWWSMWPFPAWTLSRSLKKNTAIFPLSVLVQFYSVYSHYATWHTNQNNWHYTLLPKKWFGYILTFLQRFCFRYLYQTLHKCGTRHGLAPHFNWPNHRCK